MMERRAIPGIGDQTRLPVFRAFLIGQLLVTVVPAVSALVAHATLAQVLGYSGADPAAAGVLVAATAFAAGLGYGQWDAGRRARGA
jgi:hypothetical protein